MTTTPDEAENPASATEVTGRARREAGERQRVAELHGKLDRRLLSLGCDAT